MLARRPIPLSLSKSKIPGPSDGFLSAITVSAPGPETSSVTNDLLASVKAYERELAGISDGWASFHAAESGSQPSDHLPVRVARPRIAPIFSVSHVGVAIGATSIVSVNAPVRPLSSVVASTT